MSLQNYGDLSTLRVLALLIASVIFGTLLVLIHPYLATLIAVALFIGLAVLLSREEEKWIDLEDAMRRTDRRWQGLRDIRYRRLYWRRVILNNIRDEIDREKAFPG